jgi:P-type Cu+ transporter
MNESVIDPVCGMTIDPATAAGSATYGGQTYHFCAHACETKFNAAPQLFVVMSAAAQAPSCCSPGQPCC